MLLLYNFSFTKKICNGADLPRKGKKINLYSYTIVV